MTLFADPRLVTTLKECFFYHTMDLPGFGVVQGCWDLRDDFDEYVGGVELQHKTVLDVGTASGFLTFEAEKRGAQVVSFEIADASSQALLPFKDGLYYRNHKEWLTFQTGTYEPMKNSYWLAHRLYRSRAKVYYGNIYDLPETLGPFDVVFVGSVLEHLKDPVGALASISKLTGDVLVLNTPMLWTREKIAGFVPSADDPTQDYTWWIYSLGIYEQVFAMLGFHIEKVQDIFCLLRGVKSLRTTLVARRTPLPQNSSKNGTASGENGWFGRLPTPAKVRHQSLDELVEELEMTRARLAALESLGPEALGLARRWHRLANRHPKTFSFFRSVVHSLTRRGEPYVVAGQEHPRRARWF